jgi:outer membrane protein assembly factor BamB
MLQEGADGISQYWVPQSFSDGPNPDMIKAKETTRWLNKEILAPFGELVSRAKPGYLKVGIVNTLAQLTMSEFKSIRTANQLEELWIACWRMGYPSVFLREPDLEKSLDGYQVIFVPGIRFKGELTAKAIEQLKKFAATPGCKVVVERDSTLDSEIPGVTKLKDFDLMNYFLGAGYNPSAVDDELDRVFDKSQPAVDYLGPKMAEWGIEAAARGTFKVGPNWRTSGGIHYLIMSNYEDPNYEQTSKDIMAKPVRMPLTVPAYRGEVAYDLLARAELPLGRAGTNNQERSLVLDMTRCQGSLVAFLPEKIAALRASARTDAATGAVLLNGALVGESGKTMAGLIPTRIRLLNDKGRPLFSLYRALDSEKDLELILPLTTGGLTLEVTENISGKSCNLTFAAPAGIETALRLEDTRAPFVPYPSEVARFLKSNTNALLVVGRGLEGSKAEVDRLIAGLGAKGLNVTVVTENLASAWRAPSGNSGISAGSPGDGFHSWAGGGAMIAPRVRVDSPLIILSSARGSFLLNSLTEKGFVTEVPAGAAGLPMQPTLQVASRGFHPKFDTLCLVANDGDSVRGVVSRVLEGPASAEKPPAAPSYGQPEKRESHETITLPSALSFMGNNEYVLDIKLDAATNLYIITWGHGDNLYSLDPKGNLRFSRRLPEMGACRLDMDVDRVVVFTAYGSRLYQVALDGKPISQAQLTLDLGVNDRGTGYRERLVPELLHHGLEAPEMNLSSELFRYTYVPGKHHIIYYDSLLETMRVLDENYNPVTEWRGEARTDADGNVSRTSVGASACSPDGTKIAVVEEDTLVLRDLSDPQLPKLRERPGVWGSLSWRAGEPGPTVDGTHFDVNLEPVWEDAEATPGALFNLAGLGGLVADGTTALRLVRMTKEGRREIARFAPFDYFPTFVQASPDRRHIVFLDEYWNAFIHDTETGQRVGQIKLPEMGFALTFTPDSKSFLVGGLRGAVMCCDLSGKLVWNTSLATHNRSLKQAQFAKVDTDFPDSTAKLFKPMVDEPGELDKLVTLDSSRLVNGDCEAAGGWQVDTNAGSQTARVVYGDGGHQGKRCLKVGDVPVQQQVEGLIGEHFTWVLEFFHRSASPDKTVAFLAGMNVSNRYPDSVVCPFTAGPEWRFARIVLKSGADPIKMGVGFQAQDGEVLVDDITLRRIRFPSVNHMFHPPVYDVEPVILHNPLFQRDYDPLGGTLREQIPNIVLAQRNDQIANALLTDSFLQNGRLNDVSSDWYNAPLPTRDTKVSLGLTKTPRWISMVALYFNAYDQTNTTRHFDVFVSDVAQRKMVCVASIRNNRSLFRLVKFPPRLADQVVVTLVNTLPRQQTLTEVEIYGPMSGSEKVGFVDADGQNTYMGAFDRVDKRVMTVASDCAVMPVSQQTIAPRWAMPTSQIMMADRNLYLSRALGFNERSLIDAPGASAASTFRTGSMGFSPYITLYGGVLLKPGSDGNLYCIDPLSGRQFWSRKVGERLVGGPVAIGLDLYLASDTGRLYTLDLASGAILAERALSGPVLGSLATDDKNLYFMSTDGRLHAVPAAGGPELWSREVARHTDSTPAVADGVVFVADQTGTAQAVQSADGKVLWSRELGSAFVRCPVVLADRVVFGCSDGRLTALNRRTGEQLWQTQLNTRFLSYDPVPLQLTALKAVDPAAGATNAALAPATPPASAEAMPVLLCMSGGKPNLIDVRTGQPAERQLMSGGGKKDGKGAPAAGNIPGIGELMAPISYYKGYLTFVPVLFDDRPSEPMYNDSAYHRVGVGTAQLLVPIGDSASKPATGPRAINRADKPVRVDGALNEWSNETLSLDGPEGIFPVDRCTQGAANGSVTWTGYGDLGAKVYLASDSNNLYVAAKVTDDLHFNPQTGDQILNGDALQMGIVTGKDVHWSLGLALTPSGVVLQQYSGASNALSNVASRSVVRNESALTTSYELSLPLAALGLEPGAEFGFNIAVLDDDDGKGMRYGIPLALGLLGRDTKTPPPAKVYPRFVLPK